MSAFEFRILISKNCTRWRGIFKGLSQDGRLTDFSENLRASRFHKYLSNKTTFVKSISLYSTFNMEESEPDIKYVKKLLENCL
jgi:hypothetical protein